MSKNRVINRAGARELTMDEVNNVAAGTLQAPIRTLQPANGKGDVVILED